jgi:hypothetical protein
MSLSANFNILLEADIADGGKNREKLLERAAG